MSFKDFTLEALEKEFGLVIQEVQDLFAAVPAVPVSDLLAQTLAENVPLGLAINTEKARSEFIIAPVLAEVRRLRHRQVSLFSGIELNVDPEHGLNGVCDFILTRSPAQLFLRAPAVVVVEAKNENIKGGLPQCMAEMVAAHKLNEREGRSGETVHGCVTTGSNWKFLSLKMPTVTIDVSEYLIDSVGKILGILVHMVS